MASIALSTGQVEVVLRKAGIDLGRTQQFTGRQEFSGTAGQDALFRELTGGGGGFAQEEQVNVFAGQRTAFQERQRGEEQEFLGRFREDFPGILTGIEEELGLPGLRQTAFSALEGFKNLPGEIEQAAFGKDIGARQLGRIQESRTAERLPEINELLSSLQFGEEAFGRRAQRELVPFETEIGFLKDRFAREATGFNVEVEGRFSLLLQKLQNEGSLAIAEMQEATELAQLEESKRQFEKEITTINLGDREILIDRDGNEIGSYDRGRIPGGGGAMTGIDAAIDNALRNAGIGTLPQQNLGGSARVAG